ncbi:MAG TPA: hypothetical protein VGE01_01990, partial [Fimbriimonas sp.]
MPLFPALSVLVLAQGIQVPTGERIADLPSLELGERPLDFVSAPDRRRLYVKTHQSLVIVEGQKVVQSLPMNGSSMHGLLLSKDGTRIYATDAASNVRVAKVGDRLEWLPSLALPEPAAKGSAYGCGLAELPNGHLAVASSRGNEVAILDPARGSTVARIKVDVAPYDVKLAPDGKTLAVTCWSVPAEGRGKTAPTSGTPIPITSN